MFSINFTIFWYFIFSTDTSFPDNWSLLIICRLFSSDIFLSLGISVMSHQFECSPTVWILCSSLCNFSSELLSNYITCCLFCFIYCLFKAALLSFVANLILLSKSFWPYSQLNFLPMFFAKDRNSYSLHRFYHLVQLNIPLYSSIINNGSIIFYAFYLPGHRESFDQ